MSWWHLQLLLQQSKVIVEVCICIALKLNKYSKWSLLKYSFIGEELHSLEWCCWSNKTLSHRQMIKAHAEKHNLVKSLLPRRPFSTAHSLPRECVALQSRQHNSLSDRTSNRLREPSQLQCKSMENQCVFFSDRYINLALLPKETYTKLGLFCVGVRYYFFRRLPKNTTSTPELVQWHTTTLSPIQCLPTQHLPSGGKLWDVA